MSVDERLPSTRTTGPTHAALLPCPSCQFPDRSARMVSWDLADIDAPQTGLRPVAACRHLTTAGSGWSALGPGTGKKPWPSPAAVKAHHELRMPYEKRRLRPAAQSKDDRIHVKARAGSASGPTLPLRS